MKIKIGMGARPCPTCGSLSNHTPGSLTCVTLRCMEAESKVTALQEAVRGYDKTYPHHTRRDGEIARLRAMIDKCPLCGETGSVACGKYPCGTETKRGVIGIAYNQSTECRLRCELADAKDLLAEGAFALQKTINERDAAYEAIRLLYNSLAVLDKIEADNNHAVIKAKEASHEVHEGQPRLP